MKMKYVALSVLTAAVLLCGGRSDAHHSFAATYYVDQVITIKGSVTEFLFRNPHSFLKVQAPDDKGQIQIWAVEWAGGVQLSQANVAKDTLKPGDLVEVSGNPGRNPAEHRIRIKSISRSSDGFKWEGIIQ
jgi:DNA/RNA endonuclease YhcR with UshA esterase domain